MLCLLVALCCLHNTLRSNYSLTSWICIVFKTEIKNMNAIRIKFDVQWNVFLNYKLPYLHFQFFLWIIKNTHLVPVFSSTCDKVSVNPTYICVSGLMKMKMKYQQTPQTPDDFLCVLTSWRQTMTEGFLFLVGRDRREITCNSDSSQKQTFDHRHLVFHNMCFCVIQVDRFICFSN